MRALPGLLRRAGLRRGRRAAPRGQTLLEFAFAFPVFVLLIVGVMEFAAMFSVMLNVNYASRDAALLAAEVGDSQGADCVILSGVDKSLMAMSNKAEIQEIRIYLADENGDELAADVYTRGGATTCTYGDGTEVTVPYTAQSIAYPDTSRCTIVAGCGPNHPLDTVGVAITFRHGWMTPLPQLVTLPAGGITFTRSNAMRMEPTL
jgi:Flp pilus assembly protein TadG